MIRVLCDILGRKLEFSDDIVTIGRAPGCCGIGLQDSYVSRRHARIIKGENGIYYVEDLGSTNGTHVRWNTSRMLRLPPYTRAAIKDGSVIQVGRMELFCRLAVGEHSLEYPMLEIEIYDCSPHVNEKIDSVSDKPVYDHFRAKNIKKNKYESSSQVNNEHVRFNMPRLYMVQSIPAASALRGAVMNPARPASVFRESLLTRSEKKGKEKRKEVRRDRKSRLDISRVQFSAVAPAGFARGEYVIVTILMFEETYRGVVEEIIAGSDVPLKETRYYESLNVADGAKIQILLNSKDVDIDDVEIEREWNGGFKRFDFIVFLPVDYVKKQITFCATVYINSVAATTLKFIAQCSSPYGQKMGLLRKDILSAFISYASQDRPEVAKRIEAIKIARPEMKIFFDVDGLESGEDWEMRIKKEIEDADILYLCWSRFACKSEWVEKEWRHALLHKGLECIEPIPLEPPELCPPPEELSGKHFNSKWLQYAK